MILTSAGLNLAFAALDGDDWMYAVYLAVLLVFVASGALFSRAEFFRNMRSLAQWSIVLALLVLAFAFKDDAWLVWQRFAAALLPGYVAEASGELSIARGRDGMFEVEAEVNGVQVRFVFDTGASSVLLTSDDAKRAGIETSENAFWQTVDTANGTTTAAPVTIGELKVGGLRRKDVRALVARPGASSISLLGHSFLDTLPSYEVRGDRLILRYN